ncbi:uncharacterized protein METZ01_LOCUS269492, partial [marine metagenome]
VNALVVETILQKVAIVLVVAMLQKCVQYVFVVIAVIV